MDTQSPFPAGRKNTFLLLFLVCLASDLLFAGMGKDSWRYFSKPLLMPLLAAFFLSNAGTFAGLNKWILLALFFSWLGDVFLLFESRDAMFFLFGLSAFLVAHIFYILFFHRARLRENILFRGWLGLPVALYYAGLIALLYPYLGTMKLPVIVYGLVISLMLLLALHMLFARNRQAGRLMMFGAVLFVLSDSLLAINKFYQPVAYAGILVMFTYGLAQLFITVGALRFLQVNIPVMRQSR